jgi:hypothetical protein
MNADFKTEFEQLLADLTKDLRFWNPAKDEQVAPQIINMMPVPPASAADLDGEYPMLCWVDYAAEIGLKQYPAQVLIDFGIKVNEEVGTAKEQIESGSAQLDEFCNALEELRHHRIVAGYKLRHPFRRIKGDQSPGFEGAQPLPYVHGRLYLEFLPKLSM